MIIKNFIMIRKLVEIVGVITLLFTILGVITTINWTLMTSVTFIIATTGITLIILSLTGSLLRIIGFEKNLASIMLGISIALFIFSAITFFLSPRYFTEMLMYPTHFWGIVSLYSIPAICAEGALFNFFFYFPPWRLTTSTIKIPSWYGFVFIAYATLAILINFLALLKYITPSTHIIFARTILIIASMGYIYIYRKIRAL